MGRAPRADEAGGIYHALNRVQFSTKMKKTTKLSNELLSKA